MSLQTVKIKATADVWSFDCETQHVTVKLADGVTFETEVTSDEEFITREREYMGEIEYDYLPKDVPVELEIPLAVTFPEKSLPPIAEASP